DRNVTGVQTCALPIWLGTFSDRLVANVMMGGNAYLVQYLNNSTAPTSLNLNTGLATGGSWQSYSNIWRIPNRNQLTGSLSYFPRSEERRVGKECRCRE